MIEWKAVITALRGEKHIKGIRVISDIGGIESDQMQKNQINPSLTTQRKRMISAKEKSKMHRIPAILLHARISNSLMSSIKSCLCVNQNIRVLDLSGFPLKMKALQLLEKALFGNKSLKFISLARTCIGDAGLGGMVFAQ